MLSAIAERERVRELICTRAVAPFNTSSELPPFGKRINTDCDLGELGIKVGSDGHDE